ncbi:siderophore-iron utilization protein [Corynebacterium suranareeae]|uniref:Siderophore-iron utilization protein n=1 Tax=Corynebacterium suranareeae TaxID=2506452 RepID=A0A160PMS6_9CORY|nr:siderophore-interacting protein [Corynebacterium suranareeae]BAU94525.1 siderophore-iron utilization protein [Corynebacterium suranareeae]
MSNNTYYPGLPDDYEPRVHRAIVTSVRKLGQGMIRITLGGPDMHDYPTTGIGDEYVRLFFPDHPDEPVRLPFVTDRGWDYAEGVEPSQMRTYTVRKHRSGEIDVDFVEHEGGIASAWALQAQEGQELGINPPKEIYLRPVGARRQVLFADEPALPAALRIAELTASEIDTELIIEVRGAGYQLLADIPGVSYTWLRRTGNGLAPSGLVSALERTDIDDDTYVWVAAETRVTRQARKYLRHERKLSSEMYKTMGYWTDNAEEWRARYEELGEEFHAKLRELWADQDRDPEEITDETQRLYESVGL